jgi:hypothetical protein
MRSGFDVPQLQRSSRWSTVIYVLLVGATIPFWFRLLAGALGWLIDTGTVRAIGAVKAPFAAVRCHSRRFVQGRGLCGRELAPALLHTLAVQPDAEVVLPAGDDGLVPRPVIAGGPVRLQLSQPLTPPFLVRLHARFSFQPDNAARTSRKACASVVTGVRNINIANMQEAMRRCTRLGSC